MTGRQVFNAQVGHAQATDIPDTILYEDSPWDDIRAADSEDPETIFAGVGQGFGWSENLTEGMILEGAF